MATKRASRIVLGERLDIDGVAKLHTRLINCAEKGVNVNLNAGKVATVDTSSLQLLVAFINRIRENGNTVNWQSPSDALTGSASLAGIDTHLCLEQTDK